MKIAHTILLSTVLLAGCASPKIWYQPGVSAYQTQRDLAACRLAANQQVPAGNVQYIPGPGSTGAFMANAISQNDQRNNFVRDCMIVKGYQFVPANQATNSIK